MKRIFIVFSPQQLHYEYLAVFPLPTRIALYTLTSLLGNHSYLYITIPLHNHQPQVFATQLTVSCYLLS